MNSTQSDSPLHLRAQGRGPIPEGGVEVVYADAWDDLCEAATALHGALFALHRHALRHDPDYPGSAHEDKTRHALRIYEGD